MGGRNYRIGRNFEYRTMAYFRKRGYYCQRSYASKGLYDIIAIPPRINPDQRTLLIQCKKNGYVPKDELEKLKQNDKWWGLTIIAYTKKHIIKFRLLDDTEVFKDGE